MNGPDHHRAAVLAIQKKLLGKRLNYQEIYNLMDEISHERLSSVLTTYFVAASFKEGYRPEELYQFTKAMVETGTKLHFDGIVADKHSTGGVSGTRTTMIVVPIVAAAGFKIPKISSRAITTPAGTADVMETLAKVDFTSSRIEKIVNNVNGCIAWNGHLGMAPADDVIIKVEQPLAFESFDKIIMSIMAKKVAASTNHLIIDIPVGPTMKIRHPRDAELISDKFIALGKHFHMKVVTDVNPTRQPAGHGVGPYLEARDVLLVLEQSRRRPPALEEKALRLAGKLLDLCYADSGHKKDGLAEAKRILVEGLALRKFREIVRAQGGDGQIELARFPNRGKVREIMSQHGGQVIKINNYNLNAVAKILGAPKDKYGGILLKKKIGDYVRKGETLMEFHSCELYCLQEAQATLKSFPIYQFSDHL
ncbi:thymidine phosphorylase [Patescibacteria group bacterium]|nr:thymidine phosphorylase [Patescibacteria group bacterium]MCL5091758.1 thymidine phosphorylase [Patescibacteria group bacterium]